MMGHSLMMGGSMGIAMCIFMGILSLALIGGIVYLAVKLALRDKKVI